MGRPMVRNLLKAGFDVTVNSRTTASVDEMVALGAKRAASPAEAAAATEMVITMVPDSADVEAVATGPGGVLEGARAGLVIADMSTISPAVTRALSTEAAEPRVRLARRAGVRWRARRDRRHADNYGGWNRGRL